MAKRRIGLVHMPVNIPTGEVFNVSVPAESVFLSYNGKDKTILFHYDESQEQNEIWNFLLVPAKPRFENPIYFGLRDDERLEEIERLEESFLYMIASHKCGCR